MNSAEFMSDRDWRNLLREIHSGNVIPVVGPGLVTVDDGAGGSIPLYQHLAPQLAGELNLQNPENHLSFNSVAREFLRGGGELRELYITLGCLLDQLTISPSGPLLELAGIGGHGTGHIRYDVVCHWLGQCE